MAIRQRFRPAPPQTVSQEYCDGITEGREIFNREGMVNAEAHLENLTTAIKGFPASTPVGQLLRGERDFWRNQIKKQGAHNGQA